MNALFHAHSGLRYLILLVGALAVAYFVYGLAARRPLTRAVRILGSAYVGLLDLQMLLGMAMIAFGRYYPQLIGHLVCMVLAVTLAHVFLVLNRKKADPGYLFPLIAVGGSLVLIVGGIMAIGRSLLQTTT